jgi:hypothetical protein
MQGSPTLHHHTTGAEVPMQGQGQGPFYAMPQPQYAQPSHAAMDITDDEIREIIAYIARQP